MPKQTTGHHLNQWWPIFLNPFDIPRPKCVNTLRPRQNGRYFPDIFKCIFLNENISILSTISLKFVPEGPINNIPVLVQIMAWHQSGDKPLSVPSNDGLYICVTQPQWVKAINGSSAGISVDTGKFIGQKSCSNVLYLRLNAKSGPQCTQAITSLMQSRLSEGLTIVLSAGLRGDIMRWTTWSKVYTITLWLFALPLLQIWTLLSFNLLEVICFAHVTDFKLLLYSFIYLFFCVYWS